MPVILDPGSDALRTWLDPKRHEWSRDLQSLLKPFGGELDIYPVSKDVGKVGNNSPSFIIPLDSKENKSNIANFFANASKASAHKAREGKSAPHSKDKADENKVSDEILPVKPSLVKRDISDVDDSAAPPRKKANKGPLNSV
jgi:hypothetical protein